MFKTLAKKVAMGLEAFQAGLRCGKMKHDVLDISHRYPGRVVIQSDDVLLAGTGIKDLPNAMVNPKLGVIFVNRSFTSLPRRTQEAVLLHETGHQAHKHEANLTELLLRAAGSEKAITKEKEADAYAAQNGYKDEMIDFLVVLRRRLRDKGFPVKELNKRVESLRSGEWEKYKW